MGAWGTGPFDSDSALDYFASLARRHATVDSDYEVVPGSVRHAAVVSDLTATLAAVTRPATEGGYRHYLCEEAYAAAGLVAAALSRPQVRARGTRLLEAIAAHVGHRVSAAADAPDPLGLSANCGYIVLLTREHAERLRGPALEAVTALSTEPEWLQSWRNREVIRTQLDRLRSALGTSAGPDAARS